MKELLNIFDHITNYYNDEITGREVVAEGYGPGDLEYPPGGVALPEPPPLPVDPKSYYEK